MKIAIVTDSTSYLTTEEVENNNITVVPLPVVIDGKEYDEGQDISSEEFYQKLKQSQSFPVTSQPPIGKMIEIYENLVKQGYDTIISIHISSSLSGLVHSLKSIENSIDGLNLYVYDSTITIRLMGILVLEAARMAKENKTPDNIIERLDQLKKTFKVYCIVGDLQVLVRGGRLSNASAFVGTLLRIKPILTMNESHEVVALEKIRSTKKAIKRVEEIFDEQIKSVNYPLRLIVVHANSEKMALRWRKSLLEKYPDYPIELSNFGSVLGSHLGEGALALAWSMDYKKE